jgi:hypothetical protein
MDGLANALVSGNLILREGLGVVQRFHQLADEQALLSRI